MHKILVENRILIIFVILNMLVITSIVAVTVIFRSLSDLLWAPANASVWVCQMWGFTVSQLLLRILIASLRWNLLWSLTGSWYCAYIHSCCIPWLLNGGHGTTFSVHLNALFLLSGLVHSVNLLLHVFVLSSILLIIRTLYLLPNTLCIISLQFRLESAFLLISLKFIIFLSFVLLVFLLFRQCIQLFVLLCWVMLRLLLLLLSETHSAFRGI